MSINTDFYGTSSSWLNLPYTGIDEFFKLQISNPTGSDDHTVAGTLSDLTLHDKMDLNEPPDLSACYAGSDKNFGMLHVSWISERNFEVAGTSDIKGNNPFFLGGRKYNGGFSPYGYSISFTSAVDSWGMNRDSKATTMVGNHTYMANTDSGIAPLVKVGTRSIVWLLLVYCSKPDSNGRPTSDCKVMELYTYVNGKISADEDTKKNYEEYSCILSVLALPFIATDDHSRSLVPLDGYGNPTNNDAKVRSIYPVIPIYSTIESQKTQGESQQILKFASNLSRIPLSQIKTESGNVNYSNHGGDCVLLSGCGVYQDLFSYNAGWDTGRDLAHYDWDNYYPVLDMEYYETYKEYVEGTDWGVSQRSIGLIWTTPSKFGGISQFDEYCKKQIAYLGEFFTDRISVATRNDGTVYLDPDMYLGIIGSDNITRGLYSRGQENRNQSQYKVGDLIDNSTYDPDKKTPPTPSSEPVEPSRPGFTLADGHGSITYALESDEFEQIWKDIYMRSNSSWEDLVEGLALFGANPLNAILAYRWMPFRLNYTGQAPVILGRTQVSYQHTYPVIKYASSFYKQDGVFDYAHEKNFINSKHCKCRMWLPFYGFVELPMTQVLSKELEITFQYNMPDDIGVWIISFDNVIYDYYECAPYIEIPITGDNSRQIALAKQQQVLSTALTIGGAVLAVGLSAVSAGVSIAGVAATAGISAGEYVSQALANTGAALTGRAMLYGGAEAAQQIGLVGGTAGAVAAAGAGAGVSIVNNITNTANQVGTLSTNVPTKAGAAATTFLHLPMKPYIQFYTNTLMETANIGEYKKTVGIACEKWGSIDSMPENSLLCISNPTFDRSGMNENEVNMLINALNGFYK